MLTNITVLTKERVGLIVSNNPSKHACIVDGATARFLYAYQVSAESDVKDAGS